MLGTGKLQRLEHLTEQALVAQRIEHLTTDQKVGGSSPSERAQVNGLRCSEGPSLLPNL